MHPLMTPQNLSRKDQYPPTNHLAAAIKKLPKPGPGVQPQTVEIDAGPGFGVYSVTFVVRQNPGRRTQAWFWGVENGEKIGTQRPELSDPESGGDGS